jgi:hypothetical protein
VPRPPHKLPYQRPTPAENDDDDNPHWKTELLKYVMIFIASIAIVLIWRHFAPGPP